MIEWLNNTIADLAIAVSGLTVVVFFLVLAAGLGLIFLVILRAIVGVLGWM